MSSLSAVYSKEKQAFESLYEILWIQKHRGKEGFGIFSGKIEKGKELKKLFERIPSMQGIAHSLNDWSERKEIQPVEGKKGKIILAIDGMNYNLKEWSAQYCADFLEKEVEKKGVKKAVRDFIAKGNGEYAVLFQYNEKIFGFTDFLGLKPLMYGESAEFYGIASDSRALKRQFIVFPQRVKPGYLIELSKKGVKESKIIELEELRKGKKCSEKELKEALEKSIELRTKEVKKAGVFFSGGLDSSIVAKMVSEKIPETVLYTVGMKESKDLIYGEKTAKEMNLKWKAREIEKDEIEGIALKAMNALSYFERIQLESAVVEYCTAEMAAKDGMKVAFLGQCADDLFCGSRLKQGILERKGFTGVEESIFYAVKNWFGQDFHRDELMCSEFGLEMRFPFADTEFVKKALSIPAKEKILNKKDEERKHPLRKIALEIGVPKTVLERKKQSMNYGSGIHKELKNLLS